MQKRNEKLAVVISKNMLLDAFNFAAQKHEGQVRKVTQEPYVTHVIAVSYLVAAYKRSKHLDELLVAAVLHDTLEDTDATFAEISQRFTPLVASLVLELTNDERQVAKVGKLEYQAKKLAGISSYGLVIKLADRLHNLSDNPSSKMISDTVELMNRVEASRVLSKTQIEMVTEIRRICQPNALAEIAT